MGSPTPIDIVEPIKDHMLYGSAMQDPAKEKDRYRVKRNSRPSLLSQEISDDVYDEGPSRSLRGRLVSDD